MTDPAPVESPPLPEIRQCQIPGHDQYGNSAIKGAGRLDGMYMIGTTDNGSHYLSAAQVADWTVMVAAPPGG